MRIQYAAEARADLEGAVEHVARDSPGAAARLADRILAVVERLAAGEFEGPEVEMSTGESVRSWPVPPFRVYYRRETDALVVIRVYHQARRPIAK